MVAPQFLNVGVSTAMPITSIVAVGEDISDNVAIQTLDFAGRTVDSYTWVDWMGDDPCWINDEMEIVTDVTFAPGQGLWVYGSDEGQGVQTAGQVGTKDLSVKLRNGATPTGNPFPMTLKLGDILAEGDDASDNVAIQTLDYAGRTVDSYTWVNWMGDDPCWINDEMEIITDIEFAPGAGLWVYGSTETQAVRFPAPEL